MKHLLILNLCLLFLLQIAFRAVSAPLPGVGNQTVTPTPIFTVEPDIPSLIQELYLGVPAGNGYKPFYLAVDGERHRVYSLNVGFEDEGNSVSVLDTQTSQITALLKLGPQTLYPQGLLTDPYRSRLYALWRGSGSGEATSGLTIIDTETLTVTQTITDVMAIAPGPDRLYLANQTRLWVVNPDTLVELTSRSWAQGPSSGLLLLNPNLNRLYLQHFEPKELEIFAADTLESVSKYTMGGNLKRVIVDQQAGHLIVLTTDQNQTFLRTLDANGQPLPIREPILIKDSIYPDLLVSDGQTLYLTTSGNSMRTFILPNLSPGAKLPLPYYPGHVAADSVTGHIYATYAGSSRGDGHYILEIDPATDTIRPIYTYLSIIDALTDQDADRLYLLNERGTVEVLRLSDHSPIGQVETGFQTDLGRYVGAGHLSLDPQRNRLYIDGEQLRIVDTVALTVTHRLNEWTGQITPDPTGNRLYYTAVDCGTLILNANTFTGTELVFPDGLTVPPSLNSYCFYTAQLDAANQMLYGQSYTCAGGSSCGGNGFTSVYDVSDSPRFLGNISGVPVAFDPTHQRAFTYKRTADNAIFITRVERQGQTITETMRVFGASFSNRSFYDPVYDRLYSSNAVFDGDLAMLAPINLPGSLLAFDPLRQHLYFSHRGSLLIAATKGGQLELPSLPNPADEPYLTSKLFTAADGTHFRLDTANKFDSYSRLYRSLDKGQTWTMLGRGLPGSLEISALAISPDFKQSQTLLAGMSQHYSGGGGQSAGGLYRSTDGGDTWWPVTRGLNSLRITGITFSPTFSRDQTVFLNATAPNQYDEEKFFSTDGGQTWTKLN